MTVDLSQWPTVRSADHLVLLTMSRDWLNPDYRGEQDRHDTMVDTLAVVLDRWPGAVLVHGAASQGDEQAAALWRTLGGVDDPVPAWWDWCSPTRCPRGHRRRRENGRGDYCPTAGIRRNTKMVQWVAAQRMLGAYAVTVAFVLNGSSGATDCLTQAARWGIPVHQAHAWAPKPQAKKGKAA